MRIKHIHSDFCISEEVQGDRAVFLGSTNLNMLYMFNNRQTRYQGWYINLNSNSQLGGSPFLKILDSAEFYTVDGKALTVIGITLDHRILPYRVYFELEDGNRVNWQLTSSGKGLRLTFQQPLLLKLNLDIRGIYQQPVENRQFSLINRDKQIISWRYSDPTTNQSIYLSVHHAGQFEPAEVWQEAIYPRDTTRHSEPSHLWIWQPGQFLNEQSVSLGAGFDPIDAETAMRESMYTEVTFPESTSSRQLTREDSYKLAKDTVGLGLHWLQTNSGIFAGLPWFHQVWSRDELIAALGYSPEQQLLVIAKYLDLSCQRGELPTFVNAKTTCADGLGWLCLLIKEYGLVRFDEVGKAKIITFLEEALEQLREHRLNENGLIESGHNATWMDTIGRAGFRLEIQCMYGLVMDLLYQLTSQESYLQQRLIILETIRQRFQYEGTLKDGLDDVTLRPNVFLAYLLQSDLLDPAGWQSCFDTTLAALSCDWGGLASINRQDPRYQNRSSGEDNVSYHNGDSWFFVNNLAALAMHRLDNVYYAEQIAKISNSSTHEILWDHMLGMPGEIASAGFGQSWGCGLQAFSGGSYLALLKEI